MEIGRQLSVAGDVAAEDPLVYLHALTDTKLTRLDVDDLLDELLTRVRVILDVDTAAVLILESERTQELVARAACGIEEEVRQGVHVPLGVGFAGRIAVTKAAVRIDRVDSTIPSLIQFCGTRGIKTMLGVPLI